MRKVLLVAMTCALLPLLPLHAQDDGAVPHRVYDVRAGAFIDLGAMVAAAANVDVVYFGEQHGHAPGHRLQHALLEAMGRRGAAVLSLEMFERDVADVLDAYLRGDVDEAAFLEASRPWPRYATDYRPLVEHAREQGWPVIAANVPRALAGAVSRDGLAALEVLSMTERDHVAWQVVCPDDAYRRRFIAEMQRHPMGPPAEPAEEALRLQRYYLSQCVKDETMAQSIVEALEMEAGPVIHVTGAFHSDHGDGIPVRVARRNPTVRQLVITSVVVADLDSADPAPHRQRADYLLFTLRESGSTP
jgi:uncharacterized iron-regulated protein